MDPQDTQYIVGALIYLQPSKPPIVLYIQEVQWPNGLPIGSGILNEGIPET